MLRDILQQLIFSTSVFLETTFAGRFRAWSVCANLPAKPWRKREHSKKSKHTFHALEWTDEPPKVPGWYWYRHKPSRTIAMINIDVDPTEYESLPGQWAGPIPEPREPK